MCLWCSDCIIHALTISAVAWCAMPSPSWWLRRSSGCIICLLHAVHCKTFCRPHSPFHSLQILFDHQPFLRSQGTQMRDEHHRHVEMVAIDLGDEHAPVSTIVVAPANHRLLLRILDDIENHNMMIVVDQTRVTNPIDLELQSCVVIFNPADDCSHLIQSRCVQMITFLDGHRFIELLSACRTDGGQSDEIDSGQQRGIDHVRVDV